MAQHGDGPLIETSPHWLTVEVRLVNGTPNGHSLAGDNVYLDIYQPNDQGQDYERVTTLKGKADQNGVATFAEVLAAANRIAVPYCEHESVTFWGSQVPLRSTGERIDAIVRTYDVLADNSQLRIDTHQIFIIRQEDYLEVTEYMYLINPTHNAVKSSQVDKDNKSKALPVSLPLGYKNFTPIEYLAQEALVFEDTGFYDAMAVAPGGYDIKFTYQLPITETRIKFDKTFNMPTADITLFLSLVKAQPKGLDGPGEPVTLSDGKKGIYYSIGAKQAQESLAIEFVGFSSDEKNNTAIMVMAATFLAIVVIAILRIRGNRKKSD